MRTVNMAPQRMVAALEPRVVYFSGVLIAQKGSLHAFRGEHPSNRY